MRASRCFSHGTATAAADKIKVLVLSGTTASGKSALSMRLARALHGEIISADSAQIFTGMDVGTDKVSAADRAQVPHHLIDIVPPSSTTFSAHSFAVAAIAAIRDIAARGRTPIVCGGTGFYLRQLLYAGASRQAPGTHASALASSPPDDLAPNSNLRAELEAEVSRVQLDKSARCASRGESWAQLIHHFIDKLHAVTVSQQQSRGSLPSAASTSSPPDHARLWELAAHDQRRLVRRLEIFLTSATNTVPAAPRIPSLDECASLASPLAFDFRCFFLQPPHVWAARRIDYRVETMIAGGLLDEVSALLARGQLTASSPMSSIGYKASIRYLQRHDFSDTAFRAYVEEICASTRRLARRQRSFFADEEIYEFLHVDAPLVSPTAPVTPAALNLPLAAQRALEQHIARVFAMSPAEYWCEHRLSAHARLRQVALRTEAGRVLAGGVGGGSGGTGGRDRDGGQRKHSMNAYASQMHIFRSVADEERIRRSSRRESRDL